MPKSTFCTRPADEALNCRRECFQLFRLVVEGPKGAAFARAGDFLRRLMGELGTFKVANIFAYGKCLCNDQNSSSCNFNITTLITTNFSQVTTTMNWHDFPKQLQDGGWWIRLIS